MTIFKKLCVIFLFAFFIKIILIFLLRGSHPLEVFEYETIADNILKGKGFLYYFTGVPYYAYVQPLYPVVAAVVYFLTNHNRVILAVLQSVASSALVFIVYGIAVRIAGEREGLLAALITAFHPGLAVYSVTKLHPLVFDAFLYLLTVYMIMRFVELPAKRFSVFIGCVIGITLLSRITILPFLVFAGGYIFFALKDKAYKIRLVYLGIICISALIVYSPWIARNYQVFHKFVFMQTSSGENLWVGNNPQSSGSAILDSGVSARVVMSEDMKGQLNGLDELGQVSFYGKYFMGFIEGDPWLFIKLFLKKLYYFWWFSPHTGALYQGSWVVMYKIYYIVIIIFAALGLRRVLQDKTKRSILMLILAYMFSISFVHAVVNIDTRHRCTVEPFLIIFASIGFLQLVDRTLQGRLKAV